MPIKRRLIRGRVGWTQGDRSFLLGIPLADMDPAELFFSGLRDNPEAARQAWEDLCTELLSAFQTMERGLSGRAIFEQTLHGRMLLLVSTHSQNEALPKRLS